MVCQSLGKLKYHEVSKDAKTQLQEFLQGTKQSLPEYLVVEELGDAHAREFVVECTLKHKGRRLAVSAKDTSKRKAEKIAARSMLDKLGQP